MSNNGFTEASSSNAEQNGAAQSQSTEAGSIPSQGRGRGKGKKRWIQMDLSEVVIAPPVIQSQPASRPERQQATGNASLSPGNRYKQRNMQSRGATSSYTPSEPMPALVRGAHFVPSSELAVSSFVPPHLQGHQAAFSTSGLTPDESSSAIQNNENQPAPAGKKNRRQRGRGKSQVVADSSTLVARPIKGKTTFLNLPIELRERIIVEGYEMTLAELPASHPKINNKQLDMSPDAVRLRCRPPPAVTILRNPVMPIGLNSKRRKAFLWKNPGQWGPICEWMYCSKALYEMALAIRYRHIRVNAWLCDYDAATNNNNLLMSRLSYRPILENTREVAVSFAHRQDTITIKNLIEALGKMKSLRHLCIIVKGDHDWAIRDRKGTDADLLLFFELKLETLAIIWAWTDRDSNDTEPDMFYGPNGEEWVSTRAEMRMQDCQDDWMKKTYKNSPWYKPYVLLTALGYHHRYPSVLENTEKVEPGKIMTHTYRSCCNQFYFAPAEDRKLTGPPTWWETLKNPRNHPDQFRG